MNVKHALLAAVAGFAGFMVTTVAVTAGLESTIEFSVLVGLPAGALVGLITTWFVYTRQTRTESGARGRRMANGLVAAAIGFIVVMALATTFGGGVTASLLLGAGIAVVIGGLVYWRGLDLA